MDYTGPVVSLVWVRTYKVRVGDPAIHVLVFVEFNVHIGPLPLVFDTAKLCREVHIDVVVIDDGGKCGDIDELEHVSFSGELILCIPGYVSILPLINLPRHVACIDVGEWLISFSIKDHVRPELWGG